MHSVTKMEPRYGIHLLGRGHAVLWFALVSICPITPLLVPSDAAEPSLNEMKNPDGNVQPLRITIAGFIGYGLSHFEEQDDWGGASWFIPGGLQCLFRLSPHFSVGAELDHSLRPFSWDVKPGIDKIAEWSVTQTAFTALLKYEQRAQGRRPHARVGVGLYLSTGKSEFEADWGRDYELDYEPGFGASGGLGMTGDWNRTKLCVVEAVYHLSYRRIDEDGAKHRWHNSLAVQVGLGVKL